MAKGVGTYWVGCLLESECLFKESYLQKLKIKIKLVGVILWENKKRKGAHSNNIAHLQLIAVYPKQILEKRDQLTVFYLGDKFVCTH